MGTYERKVNQLKDLMRRKYKSAYNKSKEMDIDISSMTYLPCPDAFNVINIEKMHVILDRVNKIIDENKDKLKNPTCATCVHLHDREWAKRYGKEGQFSDSDKKTAENFGCEYMDVDDFADKYKD